VALGAGDRARARPTCEGSSRDRARPAGRPSDAFGCRRFRGSPDPSPVPFRAHARLPRVLRLSSYQSPPDVGIAGRPSGVRSFDLAIAVAKRAVALAHASLVLASRRFRRHVDVGRSSRVRLRAMPARASDFWSSSRAWRGRVDAGAFARDPANETRFLVERCQAFVVILRSGKRPRGLRRVFEQRRIVGSASSVSRESLVVPSRSSACSSGESLRTFFELIDLQLGRRCEGLACCCGSVRR